MRTVVVGYVPKPEGRAALGTAIEEARLRGSGLVVVVSQRRGGRGAEPEDVEAEAVLAEVTQRLEGSGVEHEVRQLVPAVEPAEDLIAVAEETDAQLIVIGLRRRTPVGKLILGSNAQRVLLDAPCPVLAVKADTAGQGG